MTADTIDNRHGTEIAAAHPLLEWLGRLHGWGVDVWDVDSQSNDIIFSPMLSGRFAIGVEDDGEPVLGVQLEDIEAIISVPWTSSAILKSFRGRSWVALSCADLGAKLQWAKKRKIRVFIPLAADLAEKFTGYGASKLRIRAIKTVKGRIVFAKGNPRSDLPLSLKGFED